MIQLLGLGANPLFPSTNFAERSACSPLDASGNIIPTKTVCKPPNAAALNAATILQAAINRFHTRVGFSPINVDGDIGPKTFAAAANIARAFPALNISPDALVFDTAALAARINAAADTLGLPALIPPSVSQAYEPDLPPEQARLAPSPSPSKIALYVLGGLAALGAGVLVYRKVKGGRGGRR